MSLRKLHKSIGKETEEQLRQTSEKFGKSIHVISLSKKHLIASLGKDTGTSLFESLKLGGVKNIGGSRGRRIPSIQRLGSEEIGGIGNGEHLYYSRGDEVAIVVSRFDKAKPTIERLFNKALSKAVKTNLFISEGTEVSEDEGLISLTKKPSRLVKVDTQYRVNSGFVLSLGKQISKFTTNIEIHLPSPEVVSGTKIIKKLERKVEKELKKTSGPIVQDVAKALSTMLEFMSEKRPNATSKSVAVVTRTFSDKTKRSSTSVKVKSAGAKSKRVGQATTSLDKILVQLNRQIPTEVKRRMHKSGDASSKRYLRNQSGTFADSVTVSGLAISAKSVTAYYNYQNRPYDVFDPRRNPGNKWSSRGRDPARYIGDSIRSLLKSGIAAEQVGKRRIFTREAS